MNHMPEDKTDWWCMMQCLVCCLITDFCSEPIIGIFNFNKENTVVNLELLSQHKRQFTVCGTFCMSKHPSQVGQPACLAVDGEHQFPSFLWLWRWHVVSWIGRVQAETSHLWYHVNIVIVSGTPEVKQRDIWWTNMNSTSVIAFWNWTSISEAVEDSEDVVVRDGRRYWRCNIWTNDPPAHPACEGRIPLLSLILGPSFTCLGLILLWVLYNW